MSTIFDEELRYVRTRHGQGWNYLSRQQQSAFIARAILQRVVSMDPTIPAERVLKVTEDAFFALTDWEDDAVNQS